MRVGPMLAPYWVGTLKQSMVGIWAATWPFRHKIGPYWSLVFIPIHTVDPFGEVRFVSFARSEWLPAPPSLRRSLPATLRTERTDVVACGGSEQTNTNKHYSRRTIPT